MCGTISASWMKRARRLSEMVQDVFDVSKAAADQLPVKPERLDLAKLLRQTLADMNEAITASGLTFRVKLPEEAVPIVADGNRLYRVFQNLLQNALQYALPGSRVYLELTAQNGRAEASCATPPGGAALWRGFHRRFVRGDKSHTDGGSGLGLSIAQSFTEACGGTLPNRDRGRPVHRRGHLPPGGGGNKTGNKCAGILSIVGAGPLRGTRFLSVVLRGGAWYNGTNVRKNRVEPDGRSARTKERTIPCGNFIRGAARIISRPFQTRAWS